MYKTAGRKEKCDVDGKNACGYCGSKTMHFGQKVMERMYKMQCGSKFQLQIENGLAGGLEKFSHRSQEAHNCKAPKSGNGPQKGDLGPKSGP